MEFVIDVGCCLGSNSAKNSPKSLESLTKKEKETIRKMGGGGDGLSQIPNVERMVMPELSCTKSLNKKDTLIKLDFDSCTINKAAYLATFSWAVGHWAGAVMIKIFV